MGTREIMYLRALSCCWLIAGGPHTTSAETEGIDPITANVIVSATRTTEALGSVAQAATVLTRDQIDRSPFSGGHQIDDLLRAVPGVQPSLLSSRYNHPTAQALTLRGLGTRRTLVLLDGVPLNDGFGGWINWGLVPDRIERIEIVQGGASNLYGTWAMGGVVQLLSESPLRGSTFKLDSQAGNYNTYTQAVSAHLGTDRIGMTLGYRWYHSNGFIPLPTDQRGPIDRPNDARHHHFSGAIAARLAPSTILRLSGTWFDEDRSFGTPLSLATRAIGTTTLSLSGESARGDHYQVSLFGQWQTFRNLTSQVTPSATLRLSEFQDRIQTIPSNDFGGSLQWISLLSLQHKLVLGADVRTIIAQSGDALFTATGPAGNTLARGQQLGGGAFAEWIYQPVDALTITPSVRSDWWTQFNARTVATNGTVTSPDARTISSVNPKLSALYRVGEWFRIVASAYQAFRAPTLNELYRSFGFGGFTFAANDQLSTERLSGVDAKIEGGEAQGLGLSWRISGHADWVKDQILFVTQGPLLAQRQNVGRTRTVGGEASLTWHPLTPLSFQLGYAYVHSVITEFPGNSSREGKFVPNVSSHQVTAGLSLSHSQLADLTIQARYLSRQYADDANTQPIADFVVLDASLQRTLLKGIRLFLNGENLTDRRYIATQTGSIKTLGTPLLVIGGIRYEH
ncbi:MAG: TonB-dependent receptor [Nitrospirae bacterium]|nr:TonB-dependent receptor [Nitrospirota bacterium]